MFVALAPSMACQPAAAQSADAATSVDQGTAAAATTPTPAASTEGTVAPHPDFAGETERWRFRITPYLWVPGVEGTLGIGDVQTDIDQSVGDVFQTVLDDLKFAAMVDFEARKDKFIVMANVDYLNLGGSYSQAPITVNYDIDLLIVGMNLGWRFADLPVNADSRFSVDGLVGFRYSYLDMSLSAFDSSAGASAAVESNQWWIDPVIGARLQLRLGDRWRFAVRGDVGGVGGSHSSDLTWQTVLMAGYQFNDVFLLGVGWRWLSYDYDATDFVFDVTMSGPFIAFSFEF